MPSALAQPELTQEQELVARSQRGDRGALGQLLRRHGPEIYRTVLLPRMGNPMAAEQALADTYARVVERIDQFEWRGVSFRAWLRTVALHVALDLLRARRREVLFMPEDLEREVDGAEAGLAPGDAADHLAEKYERDAVRKRIDDALAELHPRYAEAIRLRVLEELPRDEVAARLGVSSATFDVILHRAITALRKAVGSASVPKRRGTT